MTHVNKLIGILFFIVIAIGSASHTNPNQLPFCKGDKNTWNGCFGYEHFTINRDSAKEWRGEFQNGKPNGFGIMAYISSTPPLHRVYVGNVQNGIEHGYGTFSTAQCHYSCERTIVRGNWENGRILSDREFTERETKRIQTQNLQP